MRTFAKPRSNAVGYGTHLRWIYISLFAIVLVLGAYHLSDRSRTCASINAATQVVVHFTADGTRATSDIIITDPERIHQLIAFVNARRRVSQPQTYTMPSPQITATFYEKGRFVVMMGCGQNYLSVACAHWHGLRRATDAEIRDFKQLIRDPK